MTPFVLTARLAALAAMAVAASGANATLTQWSSVCGSTASNCDILQFTSYGSLTNAVTGGVDLGAYTGSNLAASSSGDRAQTSLKFNSAKVGAMTATGGTGTTAGVVYQDLNPAYGGLGVTKKNTAGTGVNLTSNADQIDGSDYLKLSFANTVNVRGLAFNDKNHSTVSGAFNPLKDALTGLTKFSLTVDNGAAKILSLDNFITTSLTGKNFTFKTYGSTPYYLGGMYVCAVPEPGTYALLLAGLVGVSVATRRRQA